MTGLSPDEYFGAGEAHRCAPRPSSSDEWRVQKCIRDEFIMILMMILIELTRNVLVNQTEGRGIGATAPAKMQAT
jgi:hypothetical protein